MCDVNIKMLLAAELYNFKTTLKRPKYINGEQTSFGSNQNNIEDVCSKFRHKIRQSAIETSQLKIYILWHFKRYFQCIEYETYWNAK